MSWSEFLLQALLIGAAVVLPGSLLAWRMLWGRRPFIFACGVGSVISAGLMLICAYVLKFLGQPFTLVGWLIFSCLVVIGAWVIPWIFSFLQSGNSVKGRYLCLEINDFGKQTDDEQEEKSWIGTLKQLFSRRLVKNGLIDLAGLAGTALAGSWFFRSFQQAVKIPEAIHSGWDACFHLNAFKTISITRDLTFAGYWETEGKAAGFYPPGFYAIGVLANSLDPELLLNLACFVCLAIIFPLGMASLSMAVGKARPLYAFLGAAFAPLAYTLGAVLFGNRASLPFAAAVALLPGLLALLWDSLFPRLNFWGLLPLSLGLIGMLYMQPSMVFLTAFLVLPALAGAFILAWLRSRALGSSRLGLRAVIGVGVVLLPILVVVGFGHTRVGKALIAYPRKSLGAGIKEQLLWAFAARELPKSGTHPGADAASIFVIVAGIALLGSLGVVIRNLYVSKRLKKIADKQTTSRNLYLRQIPQAQINKVKVSAWVGAWIIAMVFAVGAMQVYWPGRLVTGLLYSDPYRFLAINAIFVIVGLVLFTGEIASFLKWGGTKIGSHQAKFLYKPLVGILVAGLGWGAVSTTSRGFAREEWQWETAVKYIAPGAPGFESVVFDWEHAQWIRGLGAQLPKDARVIGSTFNGQVLLWPLGGVRSIPHSLNVGKETGYVGYLGKEFRNYKTNPLVCDTLRAVGANYVYLTDPKWSWTGEGIAAAKAMPGYQDVPLSGLEKVSSYRAAAANNAEIAAVYRIKFCAVEPDNQAMKQAGKQVFKNAKK